MRKAKKPEEAEILEAVPNIGKAIAKDLKAIGIQIPRDLKGQDPYRLYVKACETHQVCHDPCLLDVFISGVRFMENKGAKPWWCYTKERKDNFHKIEKEIKKFKVRS